MVIPRIGNWLNSPVSCPPSIGATSVTAAVIDPATTIRTGRSHFGTADFSGAALCWAAFCEAAFCEAALCWAAFREAALCWAALCRAVGAAPAGQHRTITAIPASATSAPTTGGSATTRTATASAA